MLALRNISRHTPPEWTWTRRLSDMYPAWKDNMLIIKTTQNGCQILPKEVVSRSVLFKFLRLDPSALPKLFVSKTNFRSLKMWYNTLWYSLSPKCVMYTPMYHCAIDKRKHMYCILFHPLLSLLEYFLPHSANKECWPINPSYPNLNQKKAARLLDAQCVPNVHEFDAFCQLQCVSTSRSMLGDAMHLLLKLFDRWWWMAAQTSDIYDDWKPVKKGMSFHLYKMCMLAIRSATNILL